jgi:hypothetical protein
MIGRTLAVALILAGAAPAWTPPPAYWPKPVGPPAGVAEGVLLNYGLGNKSGNITIRSGNKDQSFYHAAHPFYIDNRVVRCALPPRPGFVPSKDNCERWPAYVKLRSTRVRVPYWRGIWLRKPTRFTNKMFVVR